MDEQIINKNNLYKKDNQAFVNSLIRIRNINELTQKQLEEKSGIKQPMIARIERGDTIPRIDTLFKLLKPMGFTLSISKIEENKTAD